MKDTPTVIASPKRNLGIAVLEFEGTDRLRDRDAVGYYYTIRRSPDERDSRLAVVFSGTVFYIDTDSFELPSIEDKTTRFRAFAEAAVGDYLDEHGLPEHTQGGTSATKIECFSPHFQVWHDRPPASDDDIEDPIASHLFWSWRFAQDGWELGPSDCLRLHRPLNVIQRIVALGEGKHWTVSQRPPHSLWLSPLPDFLRERRDASPVPGQERKPAPTPEFQDMTARPPAEYVFVDEVRIADLRQAASPEHDLRKLIALCEELNQCYRSQCYHAVAALTRTILDHVPPIFGLRAFAEVANNYAGTKSFKECMLHLDSTARKIADMHLHTQMRQRETLPSRTQVNSSQEMDVLLAEIVRVLGDASEP